MTTTDPSGARATGAGAQLAQRLITALREPTFLPTIYPALFAQGVEEGSLHAYMLSALVLVGDRLGFSPVSDSPVFDRLDKLLMGEGAKRPDPVWYARGAQDIQCLIEFERYSYRSLAPKARNLLIMGKELTPTPLLVILNDWTYEAVPVVALREVQSVFARGFIHPTGMRFPQLPYPALVLETLVAEQSGRTYVHAMTPRLFVCDGEAKPHSVQDIDGGR